MHKSLSTGCVLFQLLTLNHSFIEICADAILAFLMVLAFIWFVALFVLLTC